MRKYPLWLASPGPHSNCRPDSAYAWMAKTVWSSRSNAGSWGSRAGCLRAIGSLSYAEAPCGATPMTRTRSWQRCRLRDQAVSRLPCCSNRDQPCRLQWSQILPLRRRTARATSGDESGNRAQAGGLGGCLIGQRWRRLKRADGMYHQARRDAPPGPTGFDHPGKNGEALARGEPNGGFRNAHG